MWKRRYAVRLTVPHRGGWRAWGTVRADFERSLADPVDPAMADYVRVTVALTVLTTDVADALTIAWDAFRNAAGDDLGGWEVAVTAVDQLPGFVSACDS